MKISIFGLGYVGAVTAGCLARQGHSVVGVDVQASKVEDFNQGIAPIIEPGLDVLLRKAHRDGRVRATSRGAEAIEETELSLVCVGTPSATGGGLDLQYVEQVTREIADAIRAKDRPHQLVFRSTMLPGNTRRLTQECLADLVDQRQATVFYYPEFLREGSAVQDFIEPSLTVVGTGDGGAPADPPSLFGGKDVAWVEWGTAELVKYACNAFHATKIAFANEIGRLSRANEVDGRRVMELLCRDTRLNISPTYLRPGSPFGGSCLPKDVRALNAWGRRMGLSLPLLENLLPSNDRHLTALFERIQASGAREVSILGLSFKVHTDDLRESPMVEVAQHLLGRGYRVSIYDPQLNLAALVGSNKRLIDVRMPHLATLLRGDLVEALGEAGLVLVAQRCAPLEELAKALTPRHRVLDLNGWEELRSLPSMYERFC